MMAEDDPHRYRSPDEDSGRWLDFPFRKGDIVISTRSKSGTTWMQMICALLVFSTPELPAPLGWMSPWLDWLVAPQDEVYDRLAAQGHRRFIKTHTPLDGLPLDPRATFIVVGRHPLDMAVSLYHQSANLNRERIRQLTGQPEPSTPATPPLPLHEWLVTWIDWEGEPKDKLDTLLGVMWHMADAWTRRHQSNVLLVHYEDLSADLEGEMRRIAAFLAIDVPESRWPSLVEAATFAHMKERASQVAPDANGVLRDMNAFFRQGKSGAGLAELDEDELDHYWVRTSRMAPPDLLAWLHRVEERTG